MPIGFDPSQTVEVSIPADAKLPVETRPAWRVRLLTCREHLLVDELVNRALATPGFAACNELLNEALAVGIVGWRNVRGKDGKEVPFAVDLGPGKDGLNRKAITALDDVLTKTGKTFLAGQYPEAAADVEFELKKASASPLDSPLEKSAQAAQGEPSAAPTASAAMPAK